MRGCAAAWCSQCRLPAHVMHCGPPASQLVARPLCRDGMDGSKVVMVTDYISSTAAVRSASAPHTAAACPVQHHIAVPGQWRRALCPCRSPTGEAQHRLLHDVYVAHVRLQDVVDSIMGRADVHDCLLACQILLPAMMRAGDGQNDGALEGSASPAESCCMGCW
jgi:hypothetical protein